MLTDSLVRLQICFYLKKKEKKRKFITDNFKGLSIKDSLWLDLCDKFHTSNWEKEILFYPLALTDTIRQTFFFIYSALLSSAQGHQIGKICCYKE